MESNNPDGIVKDIELARFISQFSLNMDLLSYKLSKLKSIDPKNKEYHFEYLLLADSVIVQFRAMLLENKTSNYTFQAYFKNIKREDIAVKIDQYLDQGFNAYDQEQKDAGEVNYRSIRKAMKFISDKFICHFDNVTDMDIGNANYIMAETANPYSDRYINKMLSDIIDICKS